MAYQDTVYPLNVDFFREVSDGSGPSNVVSAELINKIHNALTQVQYHTQYTLETPYGTGSVMLITQRSHKIISHDNKLFPLPLTIDATQAARYFGGNPFNRRYCLFGFASGYRIVSGQRRWFSVRCAVNTSTENGNLTCTINAVRGDNLEYETGHYVEVALMIVDPGRP